MQDPVHLDRHGAYGHLDTIAMRSLGGLFHTGHLDTIAARLLGDLLRVGGEKGQ